MNYQPKCYDSNGNEIVIPPDCHIVTSAAGTFFIPFTEEEKNAPIAKFIYRPPNDPSSPKILDDWITNLLLYEKEE